MELLPCIIGMNCKQLMAYVEDDEPGACGGAAEAVCGGLRRDLWLRDGRRSAAVCGGTSGCVMGGGAGGNGCSVSRECDGLVEAFQCDGETCSGVIGGEPGEGCEDVGVCALDLEEQAATAQACWDWS